MVGRKLSFPVLLMVLVFLIAYFIANVMKRLPGPTTPTNVLIKLDGDKNSGGLLFETEELSSSSPELENKDLRLASKIGTYRQTKPSEGGGGGGGGVKKHTDEMAQANQNMNEEENDAEGKLVPEDEQKPSFNLQELKDGFEKNKKLDHHQSSPAKTTTSTTNETKKPPAVRGIKAGARYFTDEMLLEFKEHYTNITSKFCLTTECIQEISIKIARSFPDRTNKDEWCIPTTTTTTGAANDNNNNHQTTATATTTTNKMNKKHKGLILVKVPKAASSTAAGAVLRLGNVYNCNLEYVHWMHEKAYLDYSQRNPTESFMLMTIRDPSKQMISVMFWYYVTKRRVVPSLEQASTDNHLVPRVVNFSSPILGNLRHYQGGLQTQFAALEEIPHGSAWDPNLQDLINPQDTIARVKAILNGYDFILVVERMDESLVAMSLVLGVPVGDVLTVSTKVSSSATTTKGGGEQQKQQYKQISYTYAARYRKCLPIHSGKVSTLLDGYLKSDLFRSQVYGDLILHAAANRSLDMTIERLGNDRFQKALKEYQYWKQKMKQECSSRTHFPCSHNGTPQLQKAEANCYARDQGARDLGCGYECIDDILAQGGKPPPI